MAIRKRLTAAGLCGMMLLSTAAAGEMDGNPLMDLSGYRTQLLVDGAPVSTGGQPRYFDGQVLVPLRNVLEHSGFTVDWDGASSSASFTREGTAYRLQVKTGALSGSAQGAYDVRLVDGSTYVADELFDAVDGVSVQWDDATNTAVVVSENPKDNVYVYDLGAGTLKGDVAYQMQGVVGVPEGKNRPVVLLLHGSYPVRKASDNRYDLGFSYLVNQLADAGYLAVSMNIGMNYSFEAGEAAGSERTREIVAQQTALLERAFAGEQGLFPADLTGKGDLGNVVLIGHSRAGRDIYEVAEQNKALRVKGLLSLAPSLYSPLEEIAVDVPAGIVIPQYDGDVSSLDGGLLFDRVENSANRKSDAELVYLQKGNHGGFSTAIVYPDPFASPSVLPYVMPAAAQQTFASGYVLDFVKSVLETGKTPLAEKSELPGKLHGADVIAMVDSDGKTLYSATAGKLPQTEGATVEQVIASVTLDNTAGAFMLPGGFTKYDLTRVSWEKANGAVRIPVSADLTNAKHLQIDLTQDSSDVRNRKSGQRMTVTLRDRKGATASVAVPAAPSLAWQQGEVEESDLGDGLVLRFYTTFNALGSVRLDMNAFSALNLAEITEVTLSFDQPSGSVMLREISAVS